MKLNNLEMRDLPDEWIANAVVIFEYIDSENGDLRIGYVQPKDQSNSVSIGMVERVRNTFLKDDLKGWGD